MRTCRHRGAARLLALAAALLLCLGPAPAGAAGEGPNRNIDLGEETWYLSMCAHQGRLLALHGEGLFELSTEDGEARLLSADIRGGYGPQGTVEGVDTLLAEGDSLWAINSGTGELYSLSLAPRPALSLVRRFSELPELGLGGFFIQQGRLVAFSSYAGQCWQGDIDTGKGEQQALAGVQLLCPYLPGSYAALTVQNREEGRVLRLESIDRDTLDRTVLAELGPAAAFPHALAHDASTGSLILAGRSGIGCWQPGERLREAAFYAPGDAGQLVVLGPDLVSLTVDGLLVVRSLRPEALAGRRTLSIMDPLGRGSDYLGFILSHPDTDLRFVNVMEEEGAEQRFIQHMLTRDDSVDVYMLRDQNLLDVLRRKGYALDMAADPALAAMAGRMHPAIRGALGDEKRLLAFPKEFYLTMLSYRPDAFEALGLQVPSNFLEYYRFCEDWLSGPAERHQGYYLRPLQEPAALGSLLRRYADELSAQGRPLSFNTPEMAELLRAYQALARREPSWPEGQPAWLIYQYDIPHKGEYEYLPLTAGSGAPFTLGFEPDSFKYFVVNPYSRSPELALELIRAFAEGLSAAQQMILFTDRDEPVPNPDYEAEIARQEERLAAFEKGMAEASDVERRQMEGQLAQMKENLALFREGGRFTISQADVDSWLAYRDKLYLNPFNPIPLLAAQYPAFFDSIHSDPGFNAENFLSQLDEMVDKAIGE